MYYYYSGGPNRVHNVRAGFPRLCLGKLGLSNTSQSRKTLSSSKPPQQESSFAAFRTVLDGIEAPGKGSKEPFRVPSPTLPARFRTVPSERPVSRP